MNKETKERIEKEAFEKFDDRQGYLIGGYIAGATSEHPKAWNDAIDASIIALINKGFTSQDYNGKIIIDTLKSLKL